MFGLRGHLQRNSTPSPEGAPRRYRPDVDCLRAVAVLAVILFHFDIAPARGGFVGVDVFFVISGYLITAILAAELGSGAFSMLGFYERRLRRIVPALLLVVLASTFVSVFVFLPGDLRPVGASLMQAALFTSNILFASIANDYFAADNLELTPVLHSWSLSLEGQFYLLYPWLLLGLRSRPRTLRPVLAGLAALSFAAAAWSVAHAPAAAFYLLPQRTWELLLGALAATAPPLGVRTGATRPMLQAVGLALVAAAIVGFTRATPFPGPAALLPCAGATLVLWAGSGSAPAGSSAARGALALPLIFVGRISYSLYLWHWPLIVFASYGRSGPLHTTERAGLIGLCFLLSVASWALVERPFITRRRLPRRKALFAGAALATAVVVAAAGLVQQAGQYGFAPATLPPDVGTLANGQYDSLKGDCRPGDLTAATALPCRFGAAGRDPTVLLWGNSYARMWTPTLDIDAKANDVAGVSLILSKCLPLLGEAFPDLPHCAAFNTEALAYLKTHPALRTVILAANWFISDSRLRALSHDLDALKTLGIRVVVVLAPVQPTFGVPRALALASLRHEAWPPPIDKGTATARQQPSRDIIERLRQAYGFTVVDPATRMCDGTSCPLAIDGHPVFIDAGHVSVFAAERAAGLFEPLFHP